MRAEQHTEEKILNADEVMKSPGIPEKEAIVKKIRAKGIPVISEIELAYRYKGTARSWRSPAAMEKPPQPRLIYHIFKTCGSRMRTGGKYRLFICADR